MPDQELGHVKTDINRITTLLESEHQGYQRELEDIGLNANADEICKRLKDWFSGQSIRESDWVIVYISGHGGEKFGQHWLYTFDSEENNQSLRKAIKTSSLVEYFFEGKINCPNVLLILDVCEAGKGAMQAASALTQLWSQGSYSTNNNNFSVLAAVSSRDLALDGYFVDAFEAAIKDHSWMPGEEIEFLGVSALKDRINKYLKDKCEENKKPILKAECNTIGDSSQAEFIRNPKHLKSSNQTRDKYQNEKQVEERIIDLSRKTEVLKKLKDLHDLLHSLQTSFFSPVKALTKGFPGTEKSQRNLKNYIQIDLEPIIQNLNKINPETINSRQIENEVSDFSKQADNALNNARILFGKAIEKQDANFLNEGIILIEILLRKLPSQITSSIKNLSNNLPILDLKEAIDNFNEALFNIDRKNSELDSIFQKISSQIPDLIKLIKRHFKWQKIDLEFRSIEGMRGTYFFSRLRSEWPSSDNNEGLSGQISKLCEEASSEEENSILENLKQNTEILEEFIKSDENGKDIKELFYTCQRSEDRYFDNLDKSLKKELSELCKDCDNLVSEYRKLILELRKSDEDI